MKHGLGGRLLLVLVVLLFLGAAVEMTFRAVIFPDWRSLSPKVTVRHPIYEFFTAPNLEVRRYSPPDYDVINRTNSLGLRDREQGIEADLAGLWIGGDSNTFAGGVADNSIYPALLQRRGLANANLAGEGASLKRAARVFKDMARRGHRPRKILYVMSLNNAISDVGDALARFDDPLPTIDTASPNGTTAARRVLADALVATLWQPDVLTMLGLKTRLIRNSAVYGWIKVAANGIPLMRRLTLRWGLRADRDLVHSGHPGLMRAEPDATSQRMIDSTAAYAQRISEWADRTLAAPFAMVLLPSQYDLYPRRFARYAVHHGFEHPAFRADLARRRLTAALTARGIETIDLYEELSQAAVNGESLTFLDDAHFNARGHRIIADSLARRLSTDQRLEARP